MMLHDIFDIIRENTIAHGCDVGFSDTVCETGEFRPPARAGGRARIELRRGLSAAESVVWLAYHVGELQAYLAADPTEREQAAWAFGDDILNAVHASAALSLYREYRQSHMHRRE